MHQIWDYQTSHFLFGLFPVFALQLKARAKSGIFEVGPIILLIEKI